MKLHLPTSLRSALLALLAGTCTVGTPARAAIMHAGGSLLTYTDFGSDMGRYSVYQVNDLLKHPNKDGIPTAKSPLCWATFSSGLDVAVTVDGATTQSIPESSPGPGNDG